MAWPQAVHISEPGEAELTPLPRTFWGFTILVSFQVPRLPHFGQGRTIRSRAAATDAFMDSGTCCSTMPTATSRFADPVVR